MILRIFIISQLLIGFSFANSNLSNEYSVVQNLKKYVQYFREKNSIKRPFPRIGNVQKVSAKHIVQKSIEVLSKINLLRLKNGFGQIVVTTFPSRVINKNEVFKSLKRLENEMKILSLDFSIVKSDEKKDATYLDIYKELWTISLGIDELLGRSGYTPSDVYRLSLQVVELTKFLRQSQNLKLDVEKSEKPEHKHSNHALYATYDLIDKISYVQKNLWMETIEVKGYPKRVISPTEVYDTLGIVIAELQSIKYRLGLEKEIDIIFALQKGKTSNDVIANINYAIALLPDFGFKNELIQYDRNNLVKTPADVYIVAGNILHDLKLLFEKKGIRYKFKTPIKTYGLRPTHVYQKTLENLEKINLLRSSIKLGKTAIISEPSKLISPTEVYELALRLEKELRLVLAYYNIKHEKHEESVDLEANIIPGDVYFRMQKISLMFDALRSQEYTPSDSYVQAFAVSKKVEVILAHFNKSYEVFFTKDDVLDRQIQPRDVLVSSSKFLELIQKIKKRLNIKSPKLIIEKEKNISPSDVYNGLRLIRSELNLLMINFGIDASIKEIEKVERKLPSDVNVLMKNSYENLNRLMK